MSQPGPTSASIAFRSLSWLALVLLLGVAPARAVDSMDVAERLAGALRFPTISPADPADFDGQPFVELAGYLEETYPRVHAELDAEVIADYSLLFTWRGSDPSLDHALFMAHLDVVPVEPGTEEAWTHPPFAGTIDDGFVWGRGALDVKSAVILWLEAVEALLAEGVVPERTIHLAFGHDEEIGGNAGAGSIAKLLEERGVRVAFLFDEGGTLAMDNPLLPDTMTAMVFVAEKTYLTLRLTAHGRGGHSSIPPMRTSVGRLAAAVAALEENPMPPRLTEPMRAMFEAAAPHLPLGRRMAFRNLWLTEGAVLRSMMDDQLQRVMVHTTTAPTVIHGGVKDNVVPETAVALVNFRLLPGDTKEDVVAHVRETIDEPQIDIEALGWSAAAPPANIDGEGFAIIRDSVHDVHPEAVILPALLPGATDTRHYPRVAKDAYRFFPAVVGQDLMSAFHGRDERMAIEPLSASVEMATGMVRRAALPSSRIEASQPQD